MTKFFFLFAMDLVMEEALLRCKEWPSNRSRRLNHYQNLKLQQCRQIEEIGRGKSEKKMWRKVWPSGLLKQSFMVVESGDSGGWEESSSTYKSFNFEPTLLGKIAFFSSNSSSKPPSDDYDNHCNGDGSKSSEEDGSIWKSKPRHGLDNITFDEAKTLMRLVNMESLKMKLGTDGKEVIGYSELLETCKSMGMARSIEKAIAFARVLNEAGVVIARSHGFSKKIDSD
ncbi:hypothetical protein Dsin_002038, partial [Dipteronia sinensis]